jgi:hypothetical protein
LLVVVLGLLAACSSPGSHARSGRFPTLPNGSSWRGIFVEAKFYTNHEEIFDEDLVAQGFVPVALKIWKDGNADDGDYRIQLETMELRLFLSDGTSLTARPYKDVIEDEDVAARVTREALKINFLPDQASAREGFVFFELAPPEDFESLGEARVLHRSEPLPRVLSLSDSMVEFVVTTSEADDPRVRVGLKEDVRVEAGE